MLRGCFVALLMSLACYAEVQNPAVEDHLLQDGLSRPGGVDSGSAGLAEALNSCSVVPGGESVLTGIPGATSVSGASTPTAQLPDPNTLTSLADVSTLLVNTCSRCHGPGGQKADFPISAADFTAPLRDPAKIAKIRDRLLNPARPMPPGNPNFGRVLGPRIADILNQAMLVVPK